jgi:hypothetical protein
MRKLITMFFSLVLSLAVRADAQPVASFEAVVDSVRSQAGAMRAEQIHAKSKDLSERIRKAGVSVHAMVGETSNLPSVIFNLRRRSSNPQDPRLRPDVDTLVNTMRLLRERVAVFLATAQDLRRLANKDMDLVGPAMELARVSHNLATKIRLVEGEMEKTEWPLRRAGFDAQVQLIMDDNRRISRSTGQLELETAELYKQIVSK